MAGIIGSLAMLGTTIDNQNKQPRKNPQSNKIKSKSNSINLYNSNNYKNAKKTMQELADEKYQLARNPKKTGVIPKYYNRIKHDDNDSTFSDDVSNISNVSDGKPLYEKGMDIIKKNKTVEHFMNSPKVSKGKDTFLNQFSPLSFNNPTNPVESNKIPEQVGNISRLSLERNLALNEGFTNVNDNMTYGVIPENQMTHNNMVPAFSPKRNYGYNVDNYKHLDDVKQRKLDLFTGDLKNLSYRPKTERRPLFNPMIGLTNIYGSPVVTSEYESRFIPSRERRNEKPFQPVKVTPGLNLGYNEVGKQGYHDPYRTFGPTVDQLRVANKAKITYTTPVIQGQKGSRQPTIPVVPKRRPVTFAEWGTDRMLPSYNPEISAPTIYGEVNPTNMATINRGTKERLTYGPANYINKFSTPDSLYPLVHESNKETFESDGPRNTTVVGAQQARGFNESCNVPMTQRMQSNQYLGPVHHQNDNKFYVFNTLDNIPDPNMRNIHVDTDRYGSSVGQSQYYKPQAFDHDNAIPDPNMRNIHVDTDRYGSSVGQSQYYKPHAFDHDNAIPDPNMRNIHVDTDRYGSGVGQSQYYKPQAFDHDNAIPDPTMRNIYVDTDRYGSGVGQSQYYKPQAFDQNNAIPDPTMRNMHEDVDRYGTGVGQSQYYKPQAFDQNNAVPDPTMRNIYVDTDRYGSGVGQSQYYKPQAFDKSNAVPDPTLKDMVVHNNYIYPIGYHEKERCREDAMNSRVNVIKEKLIQGRAPTSCNYSKCPSIDGTIIQLCEPLQINRDLYPDIKQQVTPKMPEIYTRTALKVPNDEWRFNSYVTYNLDKNPYINNTQHRSVIVKN
jgi:hypothetical protein